MQSYLFKGVGRPLAVMIRMTIAGEHAGTQMWTGQGTLRKDKLRCFCTNGVHSPSEGGKQPMMRPLRSSIGLGMLIAMFIPACATTTLTSAWKDPSYHGQPRKIMVIGVAKKPLNKRIYLWTQDLAKRNCNHLCLMCNPKSSI